MPRFTSRVHFDDNERAWIYIPRYKQSAEGDPTPLDKELVAGEYHILEDIQE